MMENNTTLVRMDAKQGQRPVYFVSKALSKVEARYSDFERGTLALKVAAKKLRPYFKAHTIMVLTGLPIKAILHKPKSLGRLLKWEIELIEFDIEYQPRIAIKGQLLVDFIVERLEVHNQGGGDEKWVLETDDLSRAQGGGAEIILRSSDEPAIAQPIKLDFIVSNNEAEYDVVILGLKVAKRLNNGNRPSVQLPTGSIITAGRIRG